MGLAEQLPSREYHEGTTDRDMIGLTPESTALVIGLMQRSIEPTAPTRMIGSSYLQPHVTRNLLMPRFQDRSGPEGARPPQQGA